MFCWAYSQLNKTINRCGLSFSRYQKRLNMVSLSVKYASKIFCFNGMLKELLNHFRKCEKHRKEAFKAFKKLSLTTDTALRFLKFFFCFLYMTLFNTNLVPYPSGSFRTYIKRCWTYNTKAELILKTYTFFEINNMQRSSDY